MVVHRTDGSIESIRSIVRDAKPEIVFHMASLFVAEHKPQDVIALVESNIAFGAALLEAMSLEGAGRLINTGTSWQHFGGISYRPANLYAATKQAFDALVEYYVDACALSTITLELFDTYGPGDTRRKFLSLLLEAARTQKPLVASEGEQQIDLVHIDDVASAYQAAGDLIVDCASGGVHRRFGVSSGAPVTLRGLAEEVAHVIGTSVPVIWGGRAYRTREVMQVPSVNEPLPGWMPRIGLREGIRSLAGD